jgi:predicted RNA binding protein YcfA (HicA-like mRNA interferase family)
LPKIRLLPAQKIIKVLEKTGFFKIIRQKGSHVIMMNEKGVRVVIPVHPQKM